MQPAAFAMQGTPHHDMDLHMTESGKVKEVVADRSCRTRLNVAAAAAAAHNSQPLRHYRSGAGEILRSVEGCKAMAWSRGLRPSSSLHCGNPAVLALGLAIAAMAFAASCDQTAFVAATARPAQAQMQTASVAAAKAPFSTRPAVSGWPAAMLATVAIATAALRSTPRRAPRAQVVLTRCLPVTSPMPEVSTELPTATPVTPEWNEDLISFEMAAEKECSLPHDRVQKVDAPKSSGTAQSPRPTPRRSRDFHQAGARRERRRIGSPIFRAKQGATGLAGGDAAWATPTHSLRARVQALGRGSRPICIPRHWIKIIQCGTHSQSFNHSVNMSYRGYSSFDEATEGSLQRPASQTAASLSVGARTVAQIELPQKVVVHGRRSHGLASAAQAAGYFLRLSGISALIIEDLAVAHLDQDWDWPGFDFGGFAAQRAFLREPRIRSLLVDGVVHDFEADSPGASLESSKEPLRASLSGRFADRTVNNGTKIGIFRSADASWQLCEFFVDAFELGGDRWSSAEADGRIEISMTEVFDSAVLTPVVALTAGAAWSTGGSLHLLCEGGGRITQMPGHWHIRFAALS
eukprot:s899_g19.t2